MTREWNSIAELTYSAAKQARQNRSQLTAQENRPDQATMGSGSEDEGLVVRQGLRNSHPQVSVSVSQPARQTDGGAVPGSIQQKDTRATKGEEIRHKTTRRCQSNDDKEKRAGGWGWVGLEEERRREEKKGGG